MAKKFQIVSSAEDKYYTEGFGYSKSHQGVDVADLEEHAKWRDPLNTIVHETAERYNAEKTGEKEYDPNHAYANSIELQITGKQESSHRTRGGTGSDGLTGNLYQRFDYVTSDGSYIDTREIQTRYTRNPTGNNYAKYYGGRTFNNKTPTEVAAEQKFTLDKPPKN